MSMLYRPTLWALVAATIVFGYLAQASKVEIGLSVTWVVVIWLAFEIEKLREVSANSLRERYANVIKQIDEGKPVEPKHSPPAKGGDIGDNRQMFYDFVAFADKVNENLKLSGWRLQEEATGDGVCNYSVLYNGLKVGGLKLRGKSRDYKTADSEVSAIIELWYAQLFYHGTVRSFLEMIIAIISGDTFANYERALAEVDRSLTDHLWNAVKTPEAMSRLNVSIKGRPLAFFDRGELHEANERFWADLGGDAETARRQSTVCRTMIWPRGA